MDRFWNLLRNVRLPLSLSVEIGPSKVKDGKKDFNMSSIERVLRDRTPFSDFR